MAFLEMDGVGKGFASAGGRTEVLRNLNLGIEKGEFVAIVGYSGAGKTTLISLIAGLLSPDVGEVRLEGRVVQGPGPDRGVVFQNYSLLPWMSVYENVRLAVDQVFPSWTAQQKREHTERYIALVNLTRARNQRPRELSGGMRQRVAVARALAMDPAVLLLDEPLSALDALTRATLQSEIERIWAADRKTVVMITNDVDEGILLADRIIPLSAGPGATLGPSVAVDQVYPTWTVQKRREHTERYIALVNLTRARDQHPRELSGGMRQRVAVARALAMDPAVLLLDEPLSALDALTRATLQKEIERIWAADRKTVVLITNDVDEGILLADRIIPLSAGPGATFGPAVAVDIERPRDRKALNHDPRFKKIRAEVLDYLLGAGARKKDRGRLHATGEVAAAVEVGA